MELNFEGGRVIERDIEQEMKRSYLDYAMSVIVDRALPDVRDGLKPVQRRILYSMSELNLAFNRPFKKSARIVGEVMGKYHPHGDSAIYDAMVRMAQDFSYRDPLVEGHGNFGSMDGDPPAAMRYTEARLSRLAMEMLREIDQDTVDFGPNFDGSLEQPLSLPSRFPNLLVNGSEGIAVGMATKIPPHNLGEVVDALVYLVNNPQATIEELMAFVKGPDFPTGGIILGTEGIKEAYTTGRGRIRVRAKARIEPLSGNRHQIIIDEIPYQVNKASLVEKIAALVRDKKIEGISALRDESDRNGLRIVIEIKRDASPNVVLNCLYKQTPLEDTFGAIMLALVDDEPKVLTLKQMLWHYLQYQKEVVTRRTRFQLRKAKERLHIVEGLRIALANIDEVIAIIRQSQNDEMAKTQLIDKFSMTETQAVAILDMRLRRLTGLEQIKIEQEHQELTDRIGNLEGILASETRLFEIVKEELLEIKAKYNTPRRTQISFDPGAIDIEDLITKEDIVVTMTHYGYVKRLPLTSYKSQRRGGRGIIAMNTREEDFVEHLFTTTTHSYILFFSNRGQVYRLKAYEIPESGRTARGTAIVNLLQLGPKEYIKTIFPIDDYDEDHYLVMITKNGQVKKTALSEYDSPRSAGLIGINLRDDDELAGVFLTDGKREIILVTHQGQAIRFPEEQVRHTGRATAGVKGIDLRPGDYVVAGGIVFEDADLLVVTEKGYGKRTLLKEYRAISRGGKGVRTLNIIEKNGPIIGVQVVMEHQEVMMITSEGIMIRMKVDDIPRQGRSTQGVRMMRLQDKDEIVAVALVAETDEEDEEDGDGSMRNEEIPF
ncbi:MAG: DNA gyrase subunit A [Limnochordia bacterium]|nr:DNA gyrase subunit A [Limnochordia bacterium]MDD2629931.1 DNA gyrase subunit A [Limnochordia bacterium]MDD4517358.1 DNA gyrase subunit A [Limnochordia bacterium]